ncbi:hypothetical protein [Tranquillimonas alkanivorans]|uniref:HIRAN domain-containing protein n=1 Tax=Tranquillimonas alkanivorans TaxID=441119 RepID=A0A1I5TUS7_9RHOB|nr:hypothetical protein [Tranquillimonas alkanivorans]SFP86738.1 hypothetical protein SAMN04488047_11536 [Tranquillimonas alkanivorans]
MNASFAHDRTHYDAPVRVLEKRDLPTPGQSVKVVGLSEDSARDVRARLAYGGMLRLRCAPLSARDPRAVEVRLQAGDLDFLVGYLPRALVERVRTALALETIAREVDVVAGSGALRVAFKEQARIRRLFD